MKTILFLIIAAIQVWLIVAFIQHLPENPTQEYLLYETIKLALSILGMCFFAVMILLYKRKTNLTKEIAGVL